MSTRGKIPPAAPAIRTEELTDASDCVSTAQFARTNTTPSRKQGANAQGAGGPPAHREAQASTSASQGRGDGGRAPPRLDTSRKRSVTGEKNGPTSAEKRGKGAVAPRPSRAAGQTEPSPTRNSRRSRARLARSVRQGEGQWRENYVEALRGLGFKRLALAVADCGQVVASRPCLDCGEQHAHQTIRAYCTARGCAHCARFLSAARRARLLPALERVPEWFDARREQLHKEASEAWEKASKRCAYYAAKLAKARDKGQLDRAKRAAKKLEQWDRKRKEFGLQAHFLDTSTRTKAGKPRRVVGWSWRLLTISPPWNPRNSEELTVKGLKRRYEEVLGRWHEVRRALGPAVSAVVSVELSSGGFVHLHALCFMPEFVTSKYLAQKAGCFVDVRALRAKHKPGRSTADAVRAALKEGVKYAIKNASPLSGAWIAGKRRKLVQPELAARWTVATYRRQLGRVYGEILREALALTKKEQKKKEHVEPVRTCFACKSANLGDPQIFLSAVVAARLGPLWSRSTVWERWRPPKVQAPA